MYDWPEVAGRTDAFWARVAAALRARGIAAPATLSRPADAAACWDDPALLLGQSCGLPYVSGRCGRAIAIARPVYAVEGCGPGTYRSALVCRRGDAGIGGDLDRRGRGAALAAFRGRVAAVNDYGSQSGCNALADAVLPMGDAFFGRVAVTGAHRASALAVAQGRADIAAIDAVAWALFAEIEPVAHDCLAVLGWTAETPALPYLTAPANRERIPALVGALAAAARPGEAPGLPSGVLTAIPADYQPIRAMARRLAGSRLAPDAPPLPAVAADG